jgi:hypothetical protein
MTFGADLIGGVLYPRVKVTQGADGAVTDVSATDPLPVISGALDDAYTTTPVWLSGGVTLAVPEDQAVSDASWGIPRITTRRAAVQAADAKMVTLTAGAPAPDASDLITFDGAPIGNDDIAVRDTDPHYIFIPMAVSAWRRLTITFDWAVAGAFDQPVTLSLYGASRLKAEAVSLLAATTIAATNGYSFTIGEGAVGQGGTAGGATVATMAHFSVPAINAGWLYVMLKMIAVSAAPTTGSPRIIVTRMAT